MENTNSTETVATPPTETVVTPPTETVVTPPTETVVATDFDPIGKAEADTIAAADKAKDSANATFDLVKSTIVATADTQQKLADDRTKITNSDRVLEIIRSRVPKSDRPVSENMKRLTRETAAPKGNVAVLLVGLPVGSNMEEFMEHVNAFEPNTVAIGADMYGMNGDSDIKAEHFTDDTFRSIGKEIYDLSMQQSGELSRLLHSRQPFSDIYTTALQSVQNRD
jgi:hypothetical protein